MHGTVGVSREQRAGRRRRLPRALILFPLFGLLLAVLVNNFASPLERTPFTPEDQAAAQLPDLAGVRVWGDAPVDELRAWLGHAGNGPVDKARKPITMLALSGGAEDGAFGAGILNGWSASGRRPQFTVVTGVSTGALMAPFAFLGARHDHSLKRMFTDVDRDDIFRTRGWLATLFGPSFADTEPLAGLIARHVTPALLDEIATAHAQGRRLIIATTNLDVQRPVLWDLGAIAASNAPHRLDLFRQLLLAAASVPGVFPPELIEVGANGRRFAEMHVDGGAISQVLVTLEAFQAGDERAPKRPMQVYMIINNRLDPDFQVVRGRATSIAARAVSTLIKSSARSSVLVSYRLAQRRGIPLGHAAIEEDFRLEAEERFDQTYMRRLYAYGERRAAGGDFWMHAPPQAPAQQPVLD